MEKIVLLTGASSGIGFDSAQRLAQAGYKVYGAARRVEKMEPLKAYGIIPVYMDVTDEESMQKVVSQIIQTEGRIDILVNNAGFGFFGALENVTMEDARRQMEVNVFGLARLTQLILPHMRAQGSGRIINVASIAGKMVLYFGGWYHVSKFALEAYSDALRMEMKPFGIDVVIIEPGAIKTDWGTIAADHLRDSSIGTPYEKEALREAETFRFAYTIKLLSKPSIIGKTILRAARSRCPKARYRIGFGSHSIIFLHRILPAKWWDALMRLGGKLKIAK